MHTDLHFSVRDVLTKKTESRLLALNVRQGERHATCSPGLGKWPDSDCRVSPATASHPLPAGGDCWEVSGFGDSVHLPPRALIPSLGIARDKKTRRATWQATWISLTCLSFSFWRKSLHYSGLLWEIKHILKTALPLTHNYACKMQTAIFCIIIKTEASFCISLWGKKFVTYLIKLEVFSSKSSCVSSMVGGPFSYTLCCAVTYIWLREDNKGEGRSMCLAFCGRTSTHLQFNFMTSPI